MMALTMAVAGSSAVAADWTLDTAHSSVNFTVTHMMVSRVHGQFTDFDGTASFDPKDLSTIKANFSAKVASINTDNEKRDNHLRSGDFFDAEKAPTLTFVSKKAVQTGPGAAKLTGDLTIRGVTKEVTFDVEGLNTEIKAPGAERYVVGGSATASVNRHDFGVSWNSTLDAGGVVVGDTVKIALELQFNRSAS